jgi:hypothetical protein
VSVKHAGRKPAPRGRQIRSASPPARGWVIDLEDRKIAPVIPASTHGVELAAERRHGEVLALGREHGPRSIPIIRGRIVDRECLRVRSQAADHAWRAEPRGDRL